MPPPPSYPQPAYGQPPPGYSDQAYGQPPPGYSDQTYGQGQAGYPQQGSVDHWAQPQGVVTTEDRTWATVSHIGTFLGAWIAIGILCPIVVLIAKSGSQYVRHHAYESLNFQLNGLFWIAVVTVLGIVTLGIGLLFYLPIVAWYVIFVIVASVKANAGELYRYPLILRLFNP